MNKTKNSDVVYDFPSSVLFVLGCTDLIRGFLHTFEVSWAANTFAKLNLSCMRDDQLQLLGAFGISNILTGLIYILISKKARNLSPHILILIPIAYVTGRFGLKVSNINAESPFLGKFFVLFYLSVCIVTWVVYIYRRKLTKDRG